MNFNAVCRTCLSTEYLNPIFLKSVEHKRYSTAIFVTTGIKVDIDDGLPQQMCARCVAFLNASLKFRKQCKDAEIRLLQVKNDGGNADETLAGEGDSADADNEYYNVKDMRLEIKDEEDSNLGDGNVNTNIEAENEVEDTGSDSKDATLLPIKGRPPRKPRGAVQAEKALRMACPLCQKDLSVRSMDAHMAKSHPGADARRAKCELCDSYVTREKMNRHVTMMHGTRPFRCGYCKSEYDSKPVLVAHVAGCTAKKKRTVSKSGRELTQCEVCHKTMQRASLRSHVAVTHRGLRPVCEHCGRKFGNRLRLSEHLRAKHGYEKLKCSYCEFASASSAALRNHERRHRGEKPFVCEQCGAKFHAAYLLAQHRQSHRTEKRVKCGLCCAVFKAGNSLHAHRLAVHGAARHRCPLCARAYSCRHYAVKHMRAVHRYTGPIPPLQVESNTNEM